jgi:hypothetical protein
MAPADTNRKLPANAPFKTESCAVIQLGGMLPCPTVDPLRMTWNHTGMVRTVHVEAGPIADRPLTTSRCKMRCAVRFRTGVLHLW